MPLLFFALASASSEQTSHEPCASLALHSGSNGWQSARCCPYPQELILQLERCAEIHEVEMVSRGDLLPRSVEVHLSKENSLGDRSFEHACTLDLQRSGSTTARGTRRAKQKMFLLCSGQVKLLVHEPLISGPSNPYKQVSLASVEIWGHEDALGKRWPRSSSLNSLNLGEHHDEIASVLMELGVPLSLVPVDEDSSKLATADPDTQALVRELREKEATLLESRKFGEAQQLQEHVQQLFEIGLELNELGRRKQDILPKNIEEIQKLSDRMTELEERRLHLAAFYDTEWWLFAMSLASKPFHGAAKVADTKTQLELPLSEMHETPKSARNGRDQTRLDIDRTLAPKFTDFTGNAMLSTARSAP